MSLACARCGSPRYEVDARLVVPSKEGTHVGKMASSSIHTAGEGGGRGSEEARGAAGGRRAAARAGGRARRSRIHSTPPETGVGAHQDVEERILFHAASRSQLETSSADHHVLHPWSVAYQLAQRQPHHPVAAPRRTAAAGSPSRASPSRPAVSVAAPRPGSAATSPASCSTPAAAAPTTRSALPRLHVYSTAGGEREHRHADDEDRRRVHHQPAAHRRVRRHRPHERRSSPPPGAVDDDGLPELWLRTRARSL